jgi:hypothetical protein
MKFVVNVSNENLWKLPQNGDHNIDPGKKDGGRKWARFWKLHFVLASLVNNVI